MTNILFLYGRGYVARGKWQQKDWAHLLAEIAIEEFSPSPDRSLPCTAILAGCAKSDLLSNVSLSQPARPLQAIPPSLRPSAEGLRNALDLLVHLLISV